MTLDQVQVGNLKYWLLLFGLIPIFRAQTNNIYQVQTNLIFGIIVYTKPVTLHLLSPQQADGELRKCKSVSRLKASNRRSKLRGIQLR